LVVIGIDFSIQYPAICIARDFKSFTWIAFVNANTSKVYQKFLEETNNHYPNLRIHILDPRKRLSKQNETYSGTERLKLANYSNLIDQIIQKIAANLKGEEPLVISIEGIAYGAQGNALIDISQATGMIRKAILDHLLKGRSDKFFVFSPGELKNAIGAKGNAGKFDVFKTFIENPGLATDSDLINCINTNIDKIVKGQQIASPFMDMIDAYLAVLKVHSILKELV
jgi:Holliday junction resolvasome RuvABC endonuclease subunit